MSNSSLGTVILIDDNDVDNYMHRLVIESMGAAKNIIEFEYAEDALKYFQEDPDPDIDLIFLDINMPRMNGFEFLEAYEQLDFENRPQGVIVMLTTSLRDSDQQKANQFKDVIGYESKPLTKASMQVILEKHRKS